MGQKRRERETEGRESEEGESAEELCSGRDGEAERQVKATERLSLRLV